MVDDEFRQEMLAVRERIQQRKRANKDLAGVVPGKMFDVTVADGRAFYEVVEVATFAKTTVDQPEVVAMAKVTLLPDLAFDDYVDPILGEGGWVEKSMLHGLIEWEEKRDQLFRDPHGD